MFDFYLGAVFGGSDDDLSELRFGLETLGKFYRVSEFSSRRSRFGPEFSSRYDNTLGANCRDDFGHGNAPGGQQVRFYPDPHGVVTGTDHIDPSDAPDARQSVFEVDQGIVA